MSGDEPNLARAFLYARSATGYQRSISVQLAKLRAHAAARTYIVAGEAMDGPGSVMSMRLPGFAIVVGNVWYEPPCFDVLLVGEFCRPTRDIAHADDIISKRAARGIRTEVSGGPRIKWRPVYESLDSVARHQKQHSRKASS